MTADNGNVPSKADTIRAALAEVGDHPAEAVAWLADHGHPGVRPQYVADVLRRDGRPLRKPRPGPAPAAPGRPARKPRTAARNQAGTEAAAIAAAWDAEAPAIPGQIYGEGAAAETCGQCDGPMHWTGARTVITCFACKIRRPSAGARQRAADLAERWAPRRQQGNKAPTPAEREQAQADAAEALDRIAGYRELLDRIPRGDSQRGAAVRAIHYLEQLGSQYADAQAPDDIAAAEAREVDLTGDQTGEQPGELDTVLSYAEQLAADAEREQQRAGRRLGGGGPLRLDRSPDGTYEYDDDQGDDDDQAADLGGGGGGPQLGEALAAWSAQPPAGPGYRPAAARWCELCAARRYAARPAAAACAEWPGLSPSPVDVCPACLCALMVADTDVSVIEWLGGAPPGLVLAYVTNWRALGGLDSLRPDQITGYAPAALSGSDPARNGRQRP